MTEQHRPDNQRVVITGIGVISPLGHTGDDLWAALLAGKSGVRRVESFDASDFPTQIGAEVRDFDVEEYIDSKEARRMSRCAHFAIIGTQFALEDAGLSNGFADPERVGVQLGVAEGGFDIAVEGIRAAAERGWRRVLPYALPEALANMASHHISEKFNTLGYLGTTVSVCASGTQSIYEAAELIRRGAADIVITGGSEALLNEYAFAGFCAMRGMSTRNDEPEKAVRPFDADRDGFLMGEGAGIIIVERLDQARERGATAYAEVLGGAVSSDAYHIAIPDPEGDGAARAMKWAVANAGLDLGHIDYINAHGTGTPVGDIVETKAIKKVFGEQAYNIPVSSTKSMLAHGMGTAGAFEAIACIKTIQTQTIHPTINHESPDPECDLDYVPEGPRETTVRHTLSNSFGLGGQNACLVLGRLNGDIATR